MADVAQAEAVNAPAAAVPAGAVASATALPSAEKLRGLERAKQQGSEAHRMGWEPSQNPYVRLDYRDAWLDGYYAAQKAAYERLRTVINEAKKAAAEAEK